MNCLTKLWLRYVYIKTYFILLNKNDNEAAYNAALQTDFISRALFREIFFSFLHDAEDKQEE